MPGSGSLIPVVGQGGLYPHVMRNWFGLLLADGSLVRSIYLLAHVLWSSFQGRAKRPSLIETIGLGDWPDGSSGAFNVWSIVVKFCN